MLGGMRAFLTLMLTLAPLAAAAHEPASPPGTIGQSMAAPASPPSDDAPVQTRSGKVFASRNANLPPALGPEPVKVHVLVFSDFQCPVCRRIVEATHQIPEEWPGDVRVEFLQLPLAIHSNAENAAVASLAAHRQGKFWEMHDLLFANQGALDPTSLAAYAVQAGCDPARFARDYADPALRARAQEEATLGGALGVNATPGFLVNGKLMVGWASWGAFRGQVEQDRAAVDRLLASGTKLRDVHAKRVRENLKDAAAVAAYEKGVLAPLARAGGSAAGGPRGPAASGTRKPSRRP
jgi:protein-disulfide isomerase